MAERVHAMRRIWTESEASFDGDHVSFQRIWSWPKPVQRPHPPVLVGGTGPTALDRVLDFGDEWMPNRLGGVEELARRVGELRQRAHDVGRGHIPVTVFGSPEDRELVKRYSVIGVHRVIFRVPTDDRDSLLRRLDALTPMIGSDG